jgi:ferredoxin
MIGVCHSCITPLLSGDVTCTRHRWTPDGQVLICCAQPSTDIVLDM